MPRVRCFYEDCIFVDEGYCSAAIVEVDPNEGCLTYKPAGEYLETVADDWDDDLLAEELEAEDLWDEDEDL